MAVYFADYLQGNDANTGLSFAQRVKTLACLSARVASGDEVRVRGTPHTFLGDCEWTNHAVGNDMNNLPATLTITAATNTTPIEVTTSAAHGLSTGDTVLITITGAASSNAHGIWNITKVDSTKFTLNESVGNDAPTAGSVKILNYQRIVLPAEVTKAVWGVGNRQSFVNWTASANVTASISDGLTKSGYGAQSLAIASGFTTGKIAYYTLPAALDLSAYEQLSIWYRTSAGSALESTELWLCSDTLGEVPVHKMTLIRPRVSNRWVAHTTDFGAPLGASIQSISLNALTDPGVPTILMTSLIACKASAAPDSLTLNSLVGQNTEDSPWWEITQSIVGRRLLMDTQNTTLAGSSRGWFGSAGVRPTFKLQPIIPSHAAADIGHNHLLLPASVTGVTVTGGWSAASMMTHRDADSWSVLDAQVDQILWLWNISAVGGYVDGLYGCRTNQAGVQCFLGTSSPARTGRVGRIGGTGGGSICNVSIGGVYRAEKLISSQGANGAIRVAEDSTTQLWLPAEQPNHIIYDGLYNHADGVGLSMTIFGFTPSMEFKKWFVNGGGSSGSNALPPGTCIRDMRLFKATGPGFSAHHLVIDSLVMDDIASAFSFFALHRARYRSLVGSRLRGLSTVMGLGGDDYVDNLTLTSSPYTLVANANQSRGVRVMGGSTANTGTTLIQVSTGFGMIRNFTSAESPLTAPVTENHGAVEGANYTGATGLTAATDFAVVHGTSDRSWRLRATGRIFTWHPHHAAGIAVASILCEAGKTTRFRAWARREHTRCRVRVIVRGSQLLGLPDTDVWQEVTDGAGVWQELTVDIPPPDETGVVDIRAECLDYIPMGTPAVALPITGYVGDFSVEVL